MHLNHLKYKAVVELSMSLQEPLHIGSGDFGARRALLRLNNHVVIPSSTWKGALRSIAENLARSMVESLTGLERLAILCYSEENRGIMYEWDDKHVGKYLNGLDIETFRREYERTRASFKENLLDQLRKYKQGQTLNYLGEELLTMLDIGYSPETIEEADETKLTKMFEDYLASKCPIGSLFGNSVLSGKVRIMDTILNHVTTDERPGVGINRKSGKAQDNALYFTETVSAGTEVKLRLIADNLYHGKTDAKIFAGILEWIKEIGLNVGGRKSAGLGLMELRSCRIWMWQLGVGEDAYGDVLAHPFKKINHLGINQYLSWLKVGKIE